MPTSPIFSSYRTGENRVSGSIVAVFERLPSNVLDRILGGVLGEGDSLELVRFRTQVADRRASVPDASIRGSFNYLIEVKTEHGVATHVLRDQVGRHLEWLDGAHADERVLLLTPDAEPPRGFDEGLDDRVVWTNFERLSDSIQAVLDDADDPVANDTALLLRELRRLFVTEGLTERADTVIVAARKAYPAYLKASAYVCPSTRPLRKGLGYFGFYAGGEIKPHIAAVLQHQEAVRFTRDEARDRRSKGTAEDEALADVIDGFLDMKAEEDREGLEWQVFVLSGPGDDRTLRLPHPIKNDTTTRDGRPWAWTLGHRYTVRSALEAAPATTSALEALRSD